MPTPKAFSLIFALGMLRIVELASPELTGEWEHKLQLIEQGKLTREEFMEQISELVRKVVGVIKTGEIPDVVYATVVGAVPEVRRRGAGELPQVPVPEVRLQHLEGDLGPRVVARGGGAN